MRSEAVTNAVTNRSALGVKGGYKFAEIARETVRKMSKSVRYLAETVRNSWKTVRKSMEMHGAQCAIDPHS
jgi:hypothetical protein